MSELHANFDHLPTLLTISQVCRELGISRTTVFELTRSDQLRQVRIGRAVRIPRSEIERIVNTGARTK
ncbi:MAG: helix-turn-helix domain-containing protein [Fimbriimonadaceae bacterium]|nr:helix-turn-helix domain-containing protein [Fimbriimonadaceae bacterium]